MKAYTVTIYKLGSWFDCIIVEAMNALDAINAVEIKAPKGLYTYEARVCGR